MVNIESRESGMFIFSEKRKKENRKIGGEARECCVIEAKEGHHFKDILVCECIFSGQKE